MIKKMVLIYVCENCGEYLSYDGQPLSQKEVEIIEQSDNVVKHNHPQPCCTQYEYYRKWVEAYEYYYSLYEEQVLEEI